MGRDRRANGTRSRSLAVSVVPLKYVCIKLASESMYILLSARIESKGCLHALFKCSHSSTWFTLMETLEAILKFATQMHMNDFTLNRIGKEGLRNKKL